MQIKKIKNKIVIFVVGIILIIGAGSAYWISIYMKNSFLASKKDEITIELSNMVERTGAFVIDQQRFVETLAHENIILEAFGRDEGNLQGDASLRALLRGLKSKGAQEDILIYDTNGNVVAATDEKYLHRNFAYRDYFTQGLKNESSTEVVIGEITKQRDFVFSHVVRGANGEILGLVASIVNANSVRSVVVGDKKSDDSSTRVHMLLDENGVIIESDSESYENKSIAKLDDNTLQTINTDKRYGDVALGALQYDGLLGAIKNNSGLSVFEIFDGQDAEGEVVGISPLHSFPFYVAIEFREMNYLSMLSRVYYGAGLAVMFSVILAIAIIYYFVNRFLRPLKQLRNAAEKIGQNDFDYLLSIQSGDEFEELATAFNTMGQSLLKSKQDIDIKVEQQTGDIKAKQLELENQKKAALNILEDVAVEKERSEAILRFLKSIGDGVVVADVNNKIIFFNQAAEKLTKISGKDALGREAFALLSIYKEKDEEMQSNALEEILKNDKLIHKANEHYTLKTDDNAIIALSFTAAHILDAQNVFQGHVIVMRDVTEERNIEKTKDEFLSVAAHQLRTPLSGIRWNLEMLLDGDAGKLSSEADEIVRNIDENTQRLVTLVNDLLDVSRINMGKNQEEIVPIDMCKMFQQAADGLQGLIKERGVTVSFEKVCRADSMIKAAPKHLFQALENLLSNAIKYTPNGGRVEAATEFKKKELVISIADNGIGIPKKDQERIFSKFFRASNAVLKETEGSGLGLNVVKSFIEESGGKIWFESEEGKGTTFFITLPISKDE